MKKKLTAFLLSALLLLSLVGCTQSQTAVTTAPETTVAETAPETTAVETAAEATAEATEAADYLASISGTYVELFPELSKPEYRSLWTAAVAPLVGEENAESATDMLLGMCTA